MEKLHKIFSMASCIALLCIGLQATELSDTGYCDSGACTINENVESTSTSDNVFDVSGDDYTSITVESDVEVKADTSGSVIDISGTVSGNVTNNGTLTNTTGNVITIDGGTVGSTVSSNTITNTGTMTSESGYGIYIDSASSINAYIYNGSTSVTTATMSGIYIGASLPSSRIINYGTIGTAESGYAVYIDSGARIGYIYNGYNGTVSSSTASNVVTSATIGAVYVGGYLTQFWNYGTIGTTEDEYSLYIADGGTVNAFYNGSTYITSATMGAIYVESGGTLTGLSNYGTIGTTEDGYSIYNRGNTTITLNGASSNRTASMGDIYNEGTLNIGSSSSSSSNANYGIIGNIYNSGIMSWINNYGTIGDIYNDGGTIDTITTSATNATYASSMGDIYNMNGGSINSFTVGSNSRITNIYNYGSITGLSVTGTAEDIYNYDTISMSVVATSAYRGSVGNIYNEGTLTISYNRGSIEGIYNTDTGTIGDIVNGYNSTSSSYSNYYGEIGYIYNEEGGTIGNITNYYNSTVGDIYNYGTMGYLYSYSGGSVSSIYNYKEIGAIRLASNTTETYLYSTGTINLSDNSSFYIGSTGSSFQNVRYMHIILQSSSINIGNYYFYITEDQDTFNSFHDETDERGYANGYTSVDDETYSTSSHLAIGMDSNSTITLSGTIQLEVGGDFEYNTDYSLSSLVAIYNIDSFNSYVAAAGSDYESYGLSLDDIYNAIDYNGGLEYYLTRGTSDEYFQIAKRSTSEITGVIGNNFNKYSPAHAFYKNNIITMNTLLTQSESIMYNASSQRYGFRATRNDKAIASNKIKKDYVVSNKKPYSDFIKTAAYNEDSSNEDSQYSVESSAYNTLESSDDYFFFSPFISNNVLYDSKRLKGDGLSYGFISGYNKEIGNSLVGFQIGFDYGTFNGENAMSYLDVDSLSALLGIHYRYDFSNGMFIKARGDVYYAYHTINDIYVGSYSASAKQHPNTIGVNVGITTGKQWNFTDRDSALFGVFDVEGGLNYIGLYNTKFDFYGNYNDAQYTEYHKDSFMNLLYAGVDVKYDKMFGSNWIADWIINMALGVKALVTPLPEAKVSAVSTYYASDTMYDTSSKVYTNRVFGTALLGIDCRIGENVSLMLNYVGIYGDKSMSNSGFFNVRVWW